MNAHGKTLQGYCYKFMSIFCNLGNEFLKLEYSSFVAYLYVLFKSKTSFFEILFFCKLKTCKARCKLPEGLLVKVSFAVWFTWAPSVLVTLHR